MCPECVAIFGNRLHEKPVMLRWRCVVSEKAKPIIKTTHHNINITISVNITESHSAAYFNASREIGCSRTHIAESEPLCCLRILEEEIRFGVKVPKFANACLLQDTPALHPSIDECDVEISIVVEIKETAPKACKT